MRPSYQTPSNVFVALAEEMEASHLAFWFAWNECAEIFYGVPGGDTDAYRRVWTRVHMVIVRIASLDSAPSWIRHIAADAEAVATAIAKRVGPAPRTKMIALPDERRSKTRPLPHGLGRAAQRLLDNGRFGRDGIWHTELCLEYGHTPRCDAERAVIASTGFPFPRAHPLFGIDHKKEITQLLAYLQWRDDVVADELDAT